MRAKSFGYDLRKRWGRTGGWRSAAFGGVALAFATVAAPAEDVSGVYADFAQPGEADAWSYYWGDGGGDISFSRSPLPDAAGVGRLRYVFPQTNSGGFTLACNRSVPEDPCAVRVWVCGDDSGVGLGLRIIDRTGETFFYPLSPAIDWTGWRCLSVTNMDAPAQTWGGNHDKKIDYPATLALQLGAGMKREGTLDLRRIEVRSRLTDGNRVALEPDGVPPGNVWFGAATGVTVRVRLTNRGTTAVERVISYRVTDAQGYVSCCGTQTVHLADGETIRTVAISWPTGGRFGPCQLTIDLRQPDGVFLKRLAMSAAVVPATAADTNDERFGLHLRGSETALARGVGVRWSREQISWETLEPTPGTFLWEPYDRTFDAAQRAGTRVLGLLGYCATWARRDEKAYTSPPRDVDAYAAFVFRVVERYKDRIHDWEIWNEPDSPGFWPPKPDAAEFTALLKAAYHAAKRADPACRVLNGGLLVGVNHRDNWTFLEEMYAHGAGEAFDALAWHAYCDPKSPDEGGYVRSIAKLKAIMAKHGDAAKPVWFTEEGWATAPGKARSVSESAQADDIVRAHVLALADAPVAHFFWFILRDGGNWESDFDQSYGLLHADGTPKPAFCSYAAMTASLAGKESAGVVPLATGLVGRAFANATDDVLVVWNAGTNAVRLLPDLSAIPGIVVKDHYGNPCASMATDAFEVVLSGSPVYFLAAKDRLATLRARLTAATVAACAPGPPMLLTTHLLDDFAHVRWGTDWNLGWMGSGHEGTLLSSSPEQQRHGGKSGKLAYRMDPAKGKYGLCYAQVDRMLDLPDETKAIGVWVYGDKSGNNLACRILDSSDEVFQYTLADKLDWQGWRYLEVQIGRASNHFGGDRNGRLDAPLRFQGLIVGVEPARKTEGVIFYSDLTVKE